MAWSLFTSRAIGWLPGYREMAFRSELVSVHAYLLSAVSLTSLYA